MNLAWIAAVLRPSDVAPHPNFRDADYDVSPPARLASIVLGDGIRLRMSERAEGRDSGVDECAGLFSMDTMQESLNNLVALITRGGSSEEARLCALGIVACSAAAELEDFALCEDLLSFLLEKNQAVDSPTRLVRSILLQQRSLRRRDAGQSYHADNVEAARLIDDFSAKDCVDFPRTPGAAGSYTDTLNHIAIALQRSIWSSATTLAQQEAEVHERALPSLQDQLREKRSEQLLIVDQRRASVYESFVKELFRKEISTQTYVFGESAVDLFHSELAIELYGHRYVYAARRELALLRIVQSARKGSRTGLEDTLRLLRQSESETELDVAVEWMRRSGPLSELSRDARQIIRRRLSAPLLRIPEMRVLRAAADLLTTSEASRALDAVLEALDLGGPNNVPGKWKADPLRREAAWRSAASLSNSAGRQDVVARVLLKATSSFEESEMEDRAIANALSQVEWENLSPSVVSMWVEWRNTSGHRWPITSRVVAARADIVDDATDDGESPLLDVATHLNRTFHGHSLDPAFVGHAVTLIEEAIADIRQSAARGSFSLGGVNVADIAVVLLDNLPASVKSESVRIWAFLTDFLLDARVQREDKSAAFDRLSQIRPILPDETAKRFSEGAASLLSESDRSFFLEEDIVPFPAALRFLACQKLISEASVFSAVAQLAGSSDSKGREEAARTVAAVAEVRSDAWLIGFAAQLSHDTEMDVKAPAGRALARLASVGSSLSGVANDRLLSLLDEDGLLVPLVVMKALVASDLTSEARQKIADLSDGHPSRAVRREAQKLLR
ncbi:hypothetical protein LSF60_01810 [Rhodococcus pyridinivorans]|uniref:hypothetical protein n=1 Tax=Rhodococcus pyridinivorans TaxID=103816 RepID=UPI001E3669F4|nr:hypothetical protein [Rhodococcus pyridinivorans]UGQ58324.1 hypothetical protein LSF60_01810 [Rhodococcus pyridinivorans]